MPHQAALTIIAPVEEEQDNALERLLEDLGQKPDALPFAALPNLHFARLFVLGASADLAGARLGPQLVFLSDLDAPVEPYLPDLVDAFGPAIDTIFGHCVGWPRSHAATRDARIAFLRSHSRKAAAAYVNTVGRSVDQILHEDALRRAIERFLDAPENDWPEATPVQVRAAIREWVFGEDALRWASRPAEPPERWWRAREAVHAILAPLLLLILLPILILVLPVWAVLLRLHERSDVPEHDQPDPERVEALTVMEDHVVQNPFTAVGLLKPGLFRRLTFQAVLQAVSYGVRHIFNRGRLSGIKTIHFARWVFIDERRRLFFASNYDGSQESYMDDFIDKVAWGLNAVFSNGMGYPRTRWLIQNGAKDEEAFKGYLRVHQVLTPIWYSAYPDLTAANVENNSRIRAGLYGSMTPQETKAWLRRL